MLAGGKFKYTFLTSFIIKKSENSFSKNLVYWNKISSPLNFKELYIFVKTDFFNDVEKFKNGSPDKI